MSTDPQPNLRSARGRRYQGARIPVISADEFLGPVRRAGFDFFTGVPCSFLTPVINRVLGADGLTYIAAASEGEAVAIASGAWLAGRGTVVMIQNSGLGNAVNPLSSLNFPFRIPTLLVVTWRGAPGLDDEPQHELMGAVMPDLLDLMRIPHRRFPARRRRWARRSKRPGRRWPRAGCPLRSSWRRATWRPRTWMGARRPADRAGGQAKGPPPRRAGSLPRPIRRHRTAIGGDRGGRGGDRHHRHDRPRVVRHRR